MPGLCFHFHMQPSEVRRLKVHELRAFAAYLDEYQKAGSQ